MTDLGNPALEKRRSREQVALRGVVQEAAIVVKVREAGRVVSVAVAVGVNGDGLPSSA